MKQVVRLARGDAALCAWPLDGHAIQVGSDPHDDLVVPDTRVSPRGWLVVPIGGTVRVYDVRRPSPRMNWAPFPFEHPIALGAGYTLSRHSVPDRPTSGVTEVVRDASHEAHPIALLHGTGASVRAYRFCDRPLSVGCARGNGVVLSDRAVSRVHCRIEPADRGVSVRDLGSTNGTWLDGARIRCARLRPGSLLRVGRTVLRATAGGSAPSSKGGEAVAASTRMLGTMASVERYAPLPWPVLIHGETGVGKELVARLLHERSGRARGPFVAINAGGLPGPLVESELFGHERGAFTGAVQVHRGAFERADGGTLFLDEVAELPALLQTRLLRILETWEVRRVGGESDRPVDVRLVCATHRSLSLLVRDGRFRQDLYYRVHRLSIEVPALRHRAADIEPLARHFLDEAHDAIGHKELSPEACSRLRGHSWPGNVRELRNTVELAAATTDGPVIEFDAIDRVIRRHHPAPPGVAHLRRVLAEHQGNVSAAARAVGLPRSTLRDRLKDAASRDAGH